MYSRHYKTFRKTVAEKLPEHVRDLLSDEKMDELIADYDEFKLSTEMAPLVSDHHIALKTETWSRRKAQEIAPGGLSFKDHLDVTEGIWTLVMAHQHFMQRPMSAPVSVSDTAFDLYKSSMHMV